VRRVLVPVLVAACAAVALLGVLTVGMIGWLTADAVRTPDPDPPGVDTLDRATVERLARTTLPAGATDLHTKYSEGIDYFLAACFRIPRSAVPAFTRELPKLEPADPPEPAPGCATPEPVLTGTPQHLTGPVFRTVVLSDPGDGRVTVYLTAFTT
jgi:hypothetical protein